jgi:hypothetical protein
VCKRRINISLLILKCVCFGVLSFIAKCFVRQYFYDPSKLPINYEWVPMNTELDLYSELVPITKDRGGRKYLYWKVENEFYKTMPRNQFKIELVYYVQNLHLWKNYQE